MQKKSSPLFVTSKIISGLILLAVLAAALGLPLGTRATPWYVRDQFGANLYTNNNGNVNWAGPWTDINDGASDPAAGNVQVLGGELRVSSRIVNNDVDLEGVSRAVNLSTADTARLSFYYRTENMDATDVISVDISGNGSTWVSLGTLTGASGANGRRIFDIPAIYLTANAAIRFQITTNFDQTNEAIYFDQVEVSYIEGGTHTSASVLQTVQVYYIPVLEPQALQSMVDIEGGGPGALPISPTFVYVSITITTDHTVIYYDHWEDDFEAAVNDPQQVTSDVWGDNDPTNGMPPGYTTDEIHAGDIILLNNMVDVTNWPTALPRPFKYDGGDKIASTQAIAVTRTSWATGSGTLHGGSVEMLDTSVWGTRFDVPADEGDEPTDFEYIGLTVMASEDNTDIFLNGSGTPTTTIDEGESYIFLNAAINGGDRITSSAPVQANFLTGNIGSNYESSWFTLYPFDLLGDSYYAVVNGTATPASITRVYVQNPNAGQITVYWNTYGGTVASFTVNGGATVYRTIPTTNTGAHFYTQDGSVFQAISVINSTGQAYDWGYTLIPDNQLTQQALVGWGVGQDPTLPITENGSPVWVVAVGTGTMSVCADYDGDGVGALTDGNGYNYDELLTLNTLQLAKVYDTDGDQTGMLLYLCNGSESANDRGNTIAVAWGQDPATATASAPGLDVGTTVPPLPNFTAVKNAELTNDINSNGQFDVGETFEYQIRISNTGALPIATNSITVEDIIPIYTIYVPSTTNYFSSYTGLTTSLADNTVPPATSAFPLDEGGITINEQLRIDQYFVVNFRVRINASLPGLTNILNQARISGLDLEYNPDVEIIVQPPDENARIGDTIWLDLNGDGTQNAGEPGIPGISVELRDGFCNPGVTCLTDVTDADGIYGFPNLLDGATYTVVVVPASLPAGLTQTGDPDEAGTCVTCDGQQTVLFTDPPTPTPYLDADFGYQGNATLSDTVWNDMDNDGIQDGTESGIQGVTVWLDLDNDSVQDATEPFAVTDANGQYAISGLPAGTYTVRVAGTPISGASATYDLDGSGTPGVASSVTLTNGQIRTDVDWGYRFAALSISKVSDAVVPRCPATG